MGECWDAEEGGSLALRVRVFSARAAACVEALGAEPSVRRRRGAERQQPDVAAQSLRCPPSLLRQSSAFEKEGR